MIFIISNIARKNELLFPASGTNNRTERIRYKLLGHSFFCLCGSLSLLEGTSSGYGTRRRLPDMEGTCKYTE